MAYVKKINTDQFILDCINKQYEIIHSDIHFNTFDDLLDYAQNHPKWFNESEYKTPEQFKKWKDYFFEHFYDWKPKRYSKRIVENEFSWFNLQYGLKSGYDVFKK